MNKKIIWAIGIIAILGVVMGTLALVGNNNQSDQNLGTAAQKYHMTSYDSIITTLGIIQANGCADNSDYGLESCVSMGTLTTATGTIAYVRNPFAATSTVDFASIDVTSPLNNSFAAVTYTAGTTTVIGATPSATLISSGAVATGTAVYLTNGSVGGYKTSGGNVRIEVAPLEYVSFFISVASSTVASSTIGGTYKIRWNR